MKVDAYRSQSQPSFELVVPAGVDPSGLTGTAGEGIAKLQPLIRAKTNVDLDSLIRGTQLAVVETQIAAEGAGLIRATVSFSEIG